MKKKIILLSAILICGKIFAQIELPNTISTTEKIYGLSKFWNEVNFNFAYLNKIDKDKWNSDYKSLIKEVINTNNDYDYYRLLQKFAASLKDGHTNIWMPGSLRKILYNGEFGNYKFKLKYIDGKSIITNVNTSKKNEIPIGTQVIEINGETTQNYLNSYVKPYISSSTDDFLNVWAVENMFYQPKGTIFNLKLKTPQNVIISKQLIITKAKEEVFYPKLDDKGVFEFKWLKNKIAYIGLNSFSNSSIDSLFQTKLHEIKKAKGLIIDLRKNLGGDSYYAQSIFKHLTNDDEIQQSRSLIVDYNPLFNFYGTTYNIQAKDTLQGSPENIKMLSRSYLTTNNSYFYEIPFNSFENDVTKSERIVIPTAILIGTHTASSAEDFLVFADNQPHMIKIGQATAGTTGMPMSFDMPSGGTARICIKKEIYPDGREFVGYGIQPDILVKNTYNHFLNKNDAVLKKAMEYFE